MKNIWILLICLGASFSLAAQSLIEGNVLDEEGQGIAFATILLFTGDSTFVRGTISSADGHFFFEELAANRYYLIASNL